jgi:hypothetical protein
MLIEVHAKKTSSNSGRAAMLRLTVVAGAVLAFVAVGCAAEEEGELAEGQAQGLGGDGGTDGGGDGGDDCTPTEVKECVQDRACQCTYDRRTKTTCNGPLTFAGFDASNSGTSCGYNVGSPDPDYYSGHVYSCSCRYNGVQKTETCTTLKSGCSNGEGCGEMGELCGKNPGSTGCTVTTGGACPVTKSGGSRCIGVPPSYGMGPLGPSEAARAEAWCSEVCAQQELPPPGSDAAIWVADQVAGEIFMKVVPKILKTCVKLVW